MIRIAILVTIAMIVLGLLLRIEIPRRALILIAGLAVLYAILKLTGVIDAAFPARGA